MSRFYSPLTMDEFKLKIAEAILKTSDAWIYGNGFWECLEELIDSYDMPFPITAQEMVDHKNFKKVSEAWIPVNSAKIESDLKKVAFDWENHYLVEENTESGFKMLKPDFPVMVCMAGGDWESPVHFVFYWDGKEIRAYIPNSEHNYDHKTRSALTAGVRIDGDVDIMNWDDFYENITTRIQPKP